MKVVEVRNLRKSLGGREVLRGVNLEVERGEIHGFLGPNGAGKTTTLRNLLGLLRPDAGEVRVFGREPSRDMFRRVGVMFEYEVLNPDWTVIENLLFCSYARGLGEAEAREALERVGFGREHWDKKFKELSKGMKRRVSLASALVHDPELLILDEPTSGLDPTARIEIRTLLLKLKEDGKTVLFSSHDLAEVQKVADRVTVIAGGVTRAVFKVAEVEDLEEAYVEAVGVRT
ncbi:ABC transporter ATP-binding protein [Thermococcus nautili]|uniref:ABC transporter ATP-binding protein n=1 Tax=Thermococcus nautili TaxID=195522 RepID=UPI000683F213|nr:ABC transporter ATP-binding protein [Thermococcus nautili]CAI1492847.1 Ribosomal protein S16 [Thermococcus nautili]